jgi:hypothetical protein
MFLCQYLCNGCNLYDLALLRYDDYYEISERKAFRFFRHKTAEHSEAGSEVIVPIIPPLKIILDKIAAPVAFGQLVFPFILGEEMDPDSKEAVNKIHQENKNISDRMKKVAESLGWSVCPTGTYARHSFATNLHAAKVPMEYISDAMGHSLGNRGQITMRYISPYTIQERKQYNNLLLGIKEDTEKSRNLVSINDSKLTLFEKMNAFSEDDIKEALMMLKRKEMERFEKELYG